MNEMQGNRAISGPQKYIRQEGIVDAYKIKFSNLSEVVAWVEDTENYRAEIRESGSGQPMICLFKNGFQSFQASPNYYLLKEKGQFFKVPAPLFKMWFSPQETDDKYQD